MANDKRTYDINYELEVAFDERGRFLPNIKDRWNNNMNIYEDCFDNGQRGGCGIKCNQFQAGNCDTYADVLTNEFIRVSVEVRKELITDYDLDELYPDYFRIEALAEEHYYSEIKYERRWKTMEIDTTIKAAQEEIEAVLSELVSIADIIKTAVAQIKSKMIELNAAKHEVRESEAELAVLKTTLEKALKEIA